MQRIQKTFTVESIDDFKSKLLIWAQQFDAISWLDSNQYNQKYSSFSAVLAVDEFTSIKTDYTNAFDKLKEYQSITNDYIGYLPTDKAMAEGAYEVNMAPADNLESAIMEHCSSLLSEAVPT